MATTLSIKISKLLDIDEILVNANDILKEILDTNELFKIKAWIISNGEKEKYNKKELGYDEQFFLVGLEGMEDYISMCTSNLPLQPPYVNEDEAGIWLGVCVGHKKSPIEFALAAAIAISIARKLNVNIQDDGCRWNDDFQISADEFYETIRIDRMNGDTKSKLKKFYNKLKL